ncbi:HlyD family secretion protein [Pseudoduganella flava]|uniref:HlyD family efflux transporter periplasmic adaptor subunit n=1 Tax=Pseudoduganella flava TaxID=871742 RepID=A0A562PQQ8_9BURK|nr:efflux RND transporter periplasmic adaptor subunit [Pseudoduganella flava]QGZ37936.1 HlyD family efflux transporter periplasmic adaptor subunit [Pseudoduganella flava]TWI46775.1 HlyD family secretion protein [Pseudoduganella flava]
MDKKNVVRWLVIGAVLLAGVVGVAWGWHRLAAPSGPGAGFISGNGRIEATEIDVATKLPGRVADILVDEGTFVNAGQPLAVMDTQSLRAQRDEAAARAQQARDAVAGAEAQLAVRQSDRAAAAAVVAQRESELDAASRRLRRSTTLSADGAASAQEMDDDQARVRGVNAALAAARAQEKAAQAAVAAAQAQLVGARSAVVAAQATTARIDADLADATLLAPRAGRVQYRVAQPGEVLGSGGKVLNLVDLRDVYMTFFVPETAAGRIALGSEVRIVLDAAPGIVIPARVSFVASTAQFTPKTVETASERQKLMFRVKAQIDRGLLERHLAQVKTGVPGVAWLRTDPARPWPEQLTVRKDL